MADDGKPIHYEVNHFGDGLDASERKCLSSTPAQGT